MEDDEKWNIFQVNDYYMIQQNYGRISMKETKEKAEPCIRRIASASFIQNEKNMSPSFHPQSASLLYANAPLALGFFNALQK